jgi:hypothetical protein
MRFLFEFFMQELSESVMAFCLLFEHVFALTVAFPIYCIVLPIMHIYGKFTGGGVYSYKNPDGTYFFDYTYDMKAYNEQQAERRKFQDTIRKNWRLDEKDIPKSDSQSRA